MNFEISRASSWREDKPCEIAFKESGRWIVDIKSLDDLLKFVSEYGDIIISRDNFAITIYDSYVE